MKLFIATIVMFSITALAHSPLKIIAYPYIPDLAGDGLVGLADFLQDRFYSDTGRRVQILFDFTYATDTYTPSLVVGALSTGGYDMQEIDSIILGYLIQHNAIQRIPDGVSYDGYPANVLKMTGDANGVQWGHPSYTCTNIYFSYNRKLRGNDDGHSFLEFVHDNVASNQLGWTGDLSSEPDLRLEYLDGWRDSHPNVNSQPWYPAGYSPLLSQIDQGVISNILALRDYCDLNHNNDCTDGGYYNNPDEWFTEFANGGSLVLQGFPEYTSEILKRANTDPNNPTKLHYASTAWVGNGDKPFLFTDSWVISRANCDADCVSTAKIFLNWQRQNWAELISLGKDLSPVTPRFLAVAYQPFYQSEEMCDLPDWANNYYQFFNQEINRAAALDTSRFWDNEDSQSATIESLVLTGYTP